MFIFLPILLFLALCFHLFLFRVAHLQDGLKFVQVLLCKYHPLYRGCQVLIMLYLFSFVELFWVLLLLMLIRYLCRIFAIVFPCCFLAVFEFPFWYSFLSLTVSDLLFLFLGVLLFVFFFCNIINFSLSFFMCLGQFLLAFLIFVVFIIAWFQLVVIAVIRSSALWSIFWNVLPFYVSFLNLVWSASIFSWRIFLYLRLSMFMFSLFCRVLFVFLFISTSKCMSSWSEKNSPFSLNYIWCVLIDQS